MPPTEVITTREALVILGRCDPSTVSRWVGIGRLKPAYKAPGSRGAFFFHRHEVERLRDELLAEQAS